MSKIVIMESLGISAQELAARKAPFEAQGHTFVDYEKTTDRAALIEEAKDADAIILANMPMPGEVIAACDKLKFIDVAFTGVDHVDLDACRAKGWEFLMESPTNQQFPIVPVETLKKLGEKYAYSPWAKIDGRREAVRFCTSWASREEDVRALAADIAGS